MEDRRRAIDAKLVEPSKSNPGYYKYQITIRELDGREHIVPSYGVDMQDAIKRIVKTERKDKMDKTYYKKVNPIMLLTLLGIWITSVVLVSITNDYRYAFMASISAVSVVFGHLLFAIIRGK